MSRMIVQTRSRTQGAGTVTEGLTSFQRHMDDVTRRAQLDPVSGKVQRYVRAYDAGLPQDITVRWLPKEDRQAIAARVAELTGQGLEVWISQGLPWNPEMDRQISSVEKRTDLIKQLRS